MKQSDTSSYYETLNLSPRASDEDIRQAYKTLAKVYHPDHNPKNRILAQKRFQKINEAYNKLKNRETQMRHSQNTQPQNDNDLGGSWLVKLAERVILSRRGA